MKIKAQVSRIKNQESRSLKNNSILARKTKAKDKALNNAACNQMLQIDAKSSINTPLK